MGNSASSLPFSIGSKVEESEGWIVSEGQKKSDGSAVTVFTANKPSLVLQNQSLLEPARHHFEYCKKLRHPMLLKVEATLDTDNPDSSSSTPTNATSTKGDWIVVTEPCISLQQWLASAPSPEELAWGLECMISALGFLHSSAQMCHGNISPNSWKVTPGGDVKLWNYSLVSTTSELSNHFQHYEQVITPLAYRSPERGGDWNACQAAGIHSTDAYGLGILIQTDFYPGTMPASLQKATSRLVSSNPKMRPRLQGLTKCPLFHTEYSKLQHELQEYQVQSVEGKIQFWSSLKLNSVTKRVALYKLLPTLQSSILQTCHSESLLKQEMYRRELLSMLHVLIGIWELRYYPDDSVIDEDYTTMIGLLMSVQDRAIRGVLLQKMKLLECKVKNKSAINTAIFEPMCSGFSDSSAALRELTLKASLQLVGSLSPSNLEKLSRYLVRLQSDPEPSIRTNAVVLIVRVAPQLGDVQREKLLMSALHRSLKDVAFDPCRLAGMQAILGYQDFTKEDLATKVLPMVVPHLLDPSTQVRATAFSVMTKCLDILKQNHDIMSLQQQQQQVQQQNVIAPPAGGNKNVTALADRNATPSHTSGTSGGPTIPTPVVPVSLASAPSSGTRYLSGLSSWMSSSTKPEQTGGVISSGGGGMPSSSTGTDSSMAATSLYAAQPPPSMTQPTTGTTTTMTNSIAATTLNDSWGDNDGDDDDDGWGDDDDDDDNDLLNDTKPRTKATTFSGPSSARVVLPNDDDEEDFFKSFDMKPKVVPVVRKSGKLTVPIKSKTTTSTPLAAAAAVPAITKLKVDKSDWDDF